MRFYYLKDVNTGHFLAVGGHFVTEEKYAMVYSERNAFRLINECENLIGEEAEGVKSLSDRKVCRLKEIPSTALIKKARKPRETKFVYQPGELKIVKKEERETERDNKKVNEDYLFAKLNVKCLGCSKVCKQSSKAVIISCPDYKKI